MTKLARAPRLGEFIPTMQPSYATIDDMMQAHNNHTIAEIKHDGYRVQVHRGKKLLKIFTRNGNELNYDCYPDIVEIAEQLPVCIIDAELVALGNNHKQVFDQVKSRFRRPGIKPESVQKYLDSNIVQDIPLELKVFDMMRFERNGLMHLPFERRTEYTEILDAHGVVPVDHAHFWGRDGLEAFIEGTFLRGQEGVVCKDPQSQYKPGFKGLDWIKFKRSESLDLVVVGFYQNEGRSDIPFTSVLVAAYNDKTNKYETLGKVATTRKNLAAEINEKVELNMKDQRPRGVTFSDKLDRESYERHVPDRYVEPEDSVVLEVKAMNLNYNANWQSCGEDNGKAYSMRIGWVDQLRPDKNPRQATTTDTISTLYELQGVRG